MHDGPYKSKIDDKAEYALGCGYLVTDTSLPSCCPVWSLSIVHCRTFSQCVFSSLKLIGTFWFPKNVSLYLAPLSYDDK